MLSHAAEEHLIITIILPGTYLYLHPGHARTRRHTRANERRRLKGEAERGGGQ